MRLKAWVWVCALFLAGLFAGAGAGAEAAVQCAKEDVWCQALVQKTKNLKARDPASEARAAMDKGDFRLGLDFYFGDPVIVASSALPGVDCFFWPHAMIGKEHTHQDVIPAGGGEHTAAARAFLSTYNRTIVSDPRFPYPDVCALSGRNPAKAYTGPVTTVGQAVRSRDVAKLKALNPTPEALNAEDALEVLPLDWAMANKDLDMAMALIDLGADVRRVRGGDGTPVGLAILKERYDLAKAWRLKGGTLPAATGLCPRLKSAMGPMFLDPPPPIPVPLPDADKIDPVSQCGWAGLLIQRGQLDMLDMLLATVPLPNQGMPDTIDDADDIGRGFRLAVLKGDDATARRLFPYVLENDSEPGDLAGWLYRHKQYDLMKARVLSQHLDAARSPAEAELWRAALAAGRYSAFALLFDYGHQVNRLSKAQWTACRAVVLKGTDGEVFDACIKTSYERSEAMITAIKTGDTAAFTVLVGDSASLQENHKIQLDDWVAAYGTPEMLTALIQAGVKPEAKYYYPSNSFRPQLFDGAEKARFDGYVAPFMSEGSNRSWGNKVIIAYQRGDDAMLSAVLASGYTGLSMAMNADIGVGNDIAKYIPGFEEVFDKQIDSEAYPERPADPALVARLQRDIPRVARSEGPQALEPLFSYVTHLGWNEVAQRIIDTGFDVKKIKDPGQFWFDFALWNSTCRPSMAHLLIQAGLPVRYTREGEAGTANLLNDLASTCHDGATIGVVICEGGFDVNEALNETGQTAFDVARARGHGDTLKTLTDLGGKPGTIAHADMHKTHKAAMAKEGFDADLWQGPDA